MKPSNDLLLVAPQHRRQFRKFIKTGEASPKFLRYLNHSQRCQLAVERSFRKSFSELALAHLFGSRLDKSNL